MKIALILNSDAGTLRGSDAAIVGSELAKIVQGAGHEASVSIAAGKDAVTAIRHACEDRKLDAVIVGGGDGSVSAAAAAAAETGATLGVLPLGTMNFFARSLAMPTDLKDATAALATGAVDSVDIAKVNDRWFVHSIALGLHPTMVAEREKMDYGSRYGKMLGSMRAFLRVVRNPRRFFVTIEADGESIVRRTAGLVVTNNPLGEGHMPFADRLDDGLLAVYITTARGWVGLTRVLAAAARGAAAEHPMVEMIATRTAEINTGTRSVEITVDGELIVLKGPLRLECLPRGLRVLRPATEAPS